MDETEIDAVRELLLSRPRPQSWQERRERLEAISDEPVAADVTIEPGRLGDIPIEWSYAPGSDPTRLLVFFHGGGYCSGSIASHRNLVVEAGRAARARTLAIGYRRAPEHPFPAALDDAYAAYGFVLAKGIAPAKVALCGDSAGGGLVLATLTRLRDAQLPLPGCAWLLSPWVDLSMMGRSLETKADVDPLIQKSYLDELAAAYLAGHDASDPLVSPLRADLGGLPPLLVQVGSAECLLDDATRIAARAGAADVSVTLEIWPKMIHAWPLWASRLGDGRRALATAAAFIEARLPI
jgi:monoterpene epsilon-lactone hydrolase